MKIKMSLSTHEQSIDFYISWVGFVRFICLSKQFSYHSISHRIKLIQGHSLESVHIENLKTIESMKLGQLSFPILK
jgi:hypothetical protein